MPRHTPFERTAIPFAEWPAPDREAWRQAIAPGTALLDAGHGADWRPATRERYLGAYGRWLRFLSLQAPLDPAIPSAQRVTPEAVDSYVAFLREAGLASRTVASYLEAVHNTLWAMQPESTWSWLRQIVNRLKRDARPVRFDASRIHPIGKVYAAALEHCDEAERLKRPRPLQHSTRFRDGLMVALAAATCLRRRNLALLELDRHLIRQSEAWYLAIPGEEVKNGVEIEGALPASLTPTLDRYVAHHRPQLLQGRQSTRLWINQYGEDLSLNQFGTRIWKASSRMGHPMMPHDFRRSAATSIAELRPDLARIIRQCLGHTTGFTAERFYNKAQMLVSSRRHNDVLAELMNEPPPP